MYKEELVVLKDGLMEKLYTDGLKRVSQELKLHQYLNNSNIMIVGTYGMIGRSLVDLLMYNNYKNNLNCHIYAVGRREYVANSFFEKYIMDGYVKFIKADVNYDTISVNEKMDYIVYAAGNTHPIEYSREPVTTIETNVIGLNNVFRFMVNQASGRLIYLSSVEIYGENRGDIEKFDEEYCGYINCNTLRAGYVESKRTGETLCQAYISKYSCDAVIVRIARVFGPTICMDDSKALSQFIKAGLYNSEIVLKSKGNQEYSYIYVLDVVSGILCALFNGKKGEVYNLAMDDTGLLLRDIAELIGKITGKKVVQKFPEEEEAKGYSIATKALLNNIKIKELGWKQCFSFKEALEMTIAIMRGKK